MTDANDGWIEWQGVTYKTLLSTAETDGKLSIVDSHAPAGSGPPRHVHHDADEIFVVLTGACHIWIEGEAKLVSAGEAAMVPRGKEHTFRITDDGPSRHLVILTPGGFEGFFADMAAGNFAIPDDMPAIVESGERHNLSFTGPPLGPEDVA